MTVEYADEKFGAAVETMATGIGTIQDRLLSAYMTFHPVSVENGDFPTDELKKEYHEIYEALTRVKDDPIKGHVPSTTEKMTDDEAADVARKIYSLHLHLMWEVQKRDKRS